MSGDCCSIVFNSIDTTTGGGLIDRPRMAKACHCFNESAIVNRTLVFKSVTHI